MSTTQSAPNMFFNGESPVPGEHGNIECSWPKKITMTIYITNIKLSQSLCLYPLFLPMAPKNESISASSNSPKSSHIDRPFCKRQTPAWAGYFG
jgi:hypothetical protein